MTNVTGRAFSQLRSRQAHRRGSLFLLTQVCSPLCKSMTVPASFNSTVTCVLFGKTSGFRLLQQVAGKVWSPSAVCSLISLFILPTYTKLPVTNLMFALFSFQVHVHDGVVLVDRHLDHVASFELATLATRLIFTELVSCPFFRLNG